VQPILDQPAGDRVEPRHAKAIVIGMREEPVAVEPAGILDLAIVNRDFGGQRLGMEPKHDVCRERPGLRGVIMHRTPPRSRFPRATAISRLSPGSTKPARVEYMPGGKCFERPISARSPSLTSMITGGRCSRAYGRPPRCRSDCRTTRRSDGTHARTASPGRLLSYQYVKRASTQKAFLLIKA
jgi:hypothetical protein